MLAALVHFRRKRSFCKNDRGIKVKSQPKSIKHWIFTQQLINPSNRDLKKKILKKMIFHFYKDKGSVIKFDDLGIDDTL